MKSNFIRTSDATVAEELKKNGFTEMSKEGNVYVFINDGKANFSEDTKKKIAYSDILCF